jgi:Domain of unknown function (DUF4226)
MMEQAGEATSAVDARQATMSGRIRSLTAADEALAGVVHAAHSTTVAALRRFAEIEAEIAALIQGQDELALDTAAGARELQRVLIAMQREIVGIVSDAAADGEAKKVVLEELLGQYPPTSGVSTT